MIHRVYSTLPSFKSITFNNGFNILLADKTPDATDKQTRNRAGKSSLVEIVHFLTGGACDKNSIFRADELVDFTFGLDFDLGDGLTSVERSGRNHNAIKVETQSSGLTLQELRANGWEDGSISNTNWRKVLGRLMFDLPPDKDASTEKYGPTFRALFAYFARRRLNGGFESPFKNTSQQAPYDTQVSISYLLGLDWTIPQAWQFVRDREKSLKTLKAEAAAGVFGDVIGTTADLRTELSVVEAKANRLRENLRAFRVLPEYRELEREAAEATQKLAELADANTIDRQLVADLEKSFATEQPPNLSDIETLYKQAGVVLPDNVGRRFEDVRRFHESVIENRKSYLGSELAAAQRRIEGRETEQSAMGSRFTKVMSILQSHGALDQLELLRQELGRHEGRIEALRDRFRAAEQLEGRKIELDMERDNLTIRLRQDYREEAEILKEAIVAFEEISSELYEVAGSLTIDASRNGPEFDIRIHGERSQGISNMQIFCFDMMLMQICGNRGIGPGFLIHDSHLFDGVDERQVGSAFHVAMGRAFAQNYQYIITLNSDMIPKTLPDSFPLNDVVLPTRLTDDTIDGGLFGIRFG